MSVNIKYKNNSIATMSDTGTKTLKTSGKYCEGDIVVENVQDGITPSGNKALTPSETAQIGIDVTNFATVSVDAIPSTYVGSGVTRKAEATVAPSTSEQTVCASGVYTTGEQKVSAITPSIVGNLDASSFATSIVAAVEGKGVTVPDGTLLDGMASLIESIEAGGGGSQLEVITIVPSEKVDHGNPLTVSHGLGKLPNLYIVFTSDKIASSSYGVLFSAAYVPEFVVGNHNSCKTCAAYYRSSWDVDNYSGTSNAETLGGLLSNSNAPISGATENDLTLCGVANNTMANLVAGKTYLLFVGVIDNA